MELEGQEESTEKATNSGCVLDLAFWDSQRCVGGRMSSSDVRRGR